MFYLDPFGSILDVSFHALKAISSFLRSLPVGGRPVERCHMGAGAGVRTLPRQVGRERGNLSNHSMMVELCGAGDGVLILVRIKVSGTRIIQEKEAIGKSFCREKNDLLC